MKHHSITCDWCEARITTHHVGYQVRHIGAYATHEGARHDFDFCNDDCLDQWRSHDRRCKRLDEQLRAQGR